MAEPTAPQQIRLSRLKGDAKKLKKESGIPHYQALDAQARLHGYRNWPQLVNAVDRAKEMAHG